MSQWYESEQTPGDSEGQGGLTCCSSWGRKETVMTKQLNNSNKVNQTFWMKYLSWYRISFFPPFIYLSIYLAEQVWAAVCGMFTCGVQDFFFFFLSCGVQDPVPWPGTEPGPPALGGWSLTQWSPGKPPISTWRKNICNYQVSGLDLYFKPEI